MSKHVDVIKEFHSDGIEPEKMVKAQMAAKELADTFVQFNERLGAMKEQLAQVQMRYAQACLSIETDQHLKKQAAGMNFGSSINYTYFCLY